MKTLVWAVVSICFLLVLASCAGRSDPPSVIYPDRVENRDIYRD